MIRKAFMSLAAAALCLIGGFVAFVCTAAHSFLALAHSHSTDGGTSFFNSTPRSIFETRRAGLA